MSVLLTEKIITKAAAGVIVSRSSISLIVPEYWMNGLKGALIITTRKFNVLICRDILFLA